MILFRKNAALRRNPAKLARFMAAVRRDHEKAVASLDSATEGYEAQRDALEKEAKRGRTQ